MPRTGKSKAARSQKQAAQAQIDSSERALERQLELLAPFRELGVEALPGLLGLSTPEGQAQYYQDYYQSPQFAAQSSAARNQQLAAAEATGGLMGSSTANNLARISPTLGLNALQNQQNLYGQLANIGLSGAGSQAGFVGQQTLAEQQALGQIGQSQAYSALAPFNTFLQLGSLAAGFIPGGSGGTGTDQGSTGGGF